MVWLSALLYYGVFIPFSLLPYRVLYLISDGVYVLMYHVIGYRKKVVLNNIRNSFPEKTDQEHKKIASDFYRHFCDVIVESFKTFTISEQEAMQRMKFANPEILKAYAADNRSVILTGGHYNNWELFAVAIDLLMDHQAIAIYKQLKNKYLDEKMRSTRGKFGLKMISTKIVKEEFEKEKNNLTATIFATDQSPSSGKNAYWTTFLNQESAMIFGPERYAQEYNYPILYGRIIKIKRGYYEFSFDLISDNPKEEAYGEITKNLMRHLERDIKQAPQYWLWTHKRWKKTRPEGVPLH
jgi:KDO2-lipid IV(A) lauroyltransferase